MSASIASCSPYNRISPGLGGHKRDTDQKSLDTKFQLSWKPKRSEIRRKSHHDVKKSAWKIQLWVNAMWGQCLENSALMAANAHDRIPPEQVLWPKHVGSMPGKFSSYGS